MYANQLDRPRDNTDQGWRNITPLQIPGACGKASSTSPNTGRQRSQEAIITKTTLPDEPLFLVALHKDPHTPIHSDTK